MENIFVLIWLLIATILGQILILFIGFTFFYLILRKVTFPVLQKVAIFYGLGSGILALSMFFSICLGLHSRLSFFPVLFVSVFLFCYFKMVRTLKEDIRTIFRIFKKLKFNYIEFFCVLILIIELFLMISYWYAYPIVAWDAWANWDVKARFIFYDGNLNYIFKNDEYQNTHVDYPILQPLNFCLFYALMFQPHHFATILLLSYFIFLLIFIFYSLRNFNLSRTYSLLITTMIATYPTLFFFTNIAYADPTLTFFYTLSSILLYYFITTRKEGYLALSSIFMGFMAWSKNEGFALLIINVFFFLLYNFFLIFKRKVGYMQSFKQILYFSSIGFIIYLPWLLICMFNKFSNDYTPYLYKLLDFGLVLQNLSIIIDVMIVIPYNIFIFWIVFYIILILNIKCIFKNERFFLLTLIIFHYLLYIAIYIITPGPIEWQINTSYERIILHLTPLCVFLIGLLLSENKKFLIDFEKNKKRSSYKFVSYIFLIIILTFIFIDIFFIRVAEEIFRDFRHFQHIIYKFID